MGFLICSLELFDKDVEEAHDFFTEDLDLPRFVNILVRVEDHCEFCGNRPFKFVIGKHFVSDCDFFGSWSVVLIAILQEVLTVLLCLLLNLLEIFLYHFSKRCILSVMCGLFVKSLLFSDSLQISLG